MSAKLVSIVSLSAKAGASSDALAQGSTTMTP